MNLWAEDAASAASIVALLPTSRTVESEQPAGDEAAVADRQRRSRISVAALVLLLILACGLWFAMRLPERKTSQPPQITPLTKTKVPTADEVQALRAYLSEFTRQSEPLQRRFEDLFRALQGGQITQPDFAERLQRWVIPPWQDLNRAQRKLTFSPGSASERLNGLLMKVTGDWQRALQNYVTGLRAGDASIVMSAFELMGEAERTQQQARKLVGN